MMKRRVMMMKRMMMMKRRVLPETETESERISCESVFSAAADPGSDCLCFKPSAGSG